MKEVISMQTSIDDFLGTKNEKYRKVLFRSFYDFDTDPGASLLLLGGAAPLRGEIGF